MILHRSEDIPAATDGAAGPAAASLPIPAGHRPDATRRGRPGPDPVRSRHGSRHPGGASRCASVAGLAAAAVSLWTARGCQCGARLSGLAAFLIGTVSGPQAAAPGFHGVYAIPDTATAVLGVLVAAGVLATAGRTSQSAPPETRLP